MERTSPLSSERDAEEAAMGRAKLRVEHITVVFKQGRQVTPVLDDVNLAVAEGEFLWRAGAIGLWQIDAVEYAGGISRADERADHD